MRYFTKSCLVVSMVMVFWFGSALAADEVRARNARQDVPCMISATNDSGKFEVAARGKCNGTGMRDRRRDGSCRS